MIFYARYCINISLVRQCRVSSCSIMKPEFNSFLWIIIVHHSCISKEELPSHEEVTTNIAGCSSLHSLSSRSICMADVPNLATKLSRKRSRAGHWVMDTTRLRHTGHRTWYWDRNSRRHLVQTRWPQFRRLVPVSNWRQTGQERSEVTASITSWDLSHASAMLEREEVRKIWWLYYKTPSKLFVGYHSLKWSHCVEDQLTQKEMLKHTWHCDLKVHLWIMHRLLVSNIRFRTSEVFVHFKIVLCTSML